MILKRFIYLVVFLVISAATQAQINVYLGGNLQGNYSMIRGEEPSMAPGFGGGVSIAYWEYEYWYLKSGIEYINRTSTKLDYADDFGITPTDQDDKINITFAEQSIVIPVTVYFRPYEWGPNTLLITGSLNTMIVASLKEQSEEYGEVVLKGAKLKTNLGIGVGYQRQLDKNLFLNIVPSYNIDLRAERAFNSITLTAEILFGIY